MITLTRVTNTSHYNLSMYGHHVVTITSDDLYTLKDAINVAIWDDFKHRAQASGLGLGLGPKSRQPLNHES
jgi:hypothetical protein